MKTQKNANPVVLDEYDVTVQVDQLAPESACLTTSLDTARWSAERLAAGVALGMEALKLDGEEVVRVERRAAGTGALLALAVQTRTPLLKVRHEVLVTVVLKEAAR